MTPIKTHQISRLFMVLISYEIPTVGSFPAAVCRLFTDVAHESRNCCKKAKIVQEGDGSLPNTQIESQYRFCENAL